MPSTPSTAIPFVASDRHRAHAPRAEIEASGSHPPFEHPGRADAIRAALDDDDRFVHVEPRAHGTDVVAAVHDAGLIEFLGRAWDDYQRAHPDTHDVVPDVFSLPALRDGIGDFGPPTTIDAELGRWCFETTTPLTAGTYGAARAAVDIAVTATDLVLDGAPVAYALCRPPGHHATERLYGGYCFFNNAAIAAHHAVSSAGSKVTVLDVDYHHGNGTQQIFYRRSDVQYVSLHGDPTRAYPYVTGFADETGAGPGAGSTRNLPLPAATDDDRYLAALATACEAIASFGADLLIVSLGVDTYLDDPMCDLAVTTDGFRRQGGMIAELGRPTLVVQEGGYAVDALGRNVRSFLGGLRRSPNVSRIDT